jgi:molybdopterin/thiamine biosynthesis adenylyltransferase
MGSRHEGLLCREERQALSHAVVCGAGAGGAGGWTYLALVRLGCRRFRIADPGEFDASNANRQAGCDAASLGLNKAEVLRRQILEVNPEADVLVYPEGVTDGNLDDFLNGATAVVDGIDLYELDIKKKLYDAARRQQKRIFSCPVLGFGAALAVFDPETSPSFDEYFGPIPERSDARAYHNYLKRIGMGFFGFKPKLDWPAFMKRVDQGKVPSVAPACLLSGAMVATAIVDSILQKNMVPTVPTTVHFDLLQMKKVTIGRVRRWFFKNVVGLYLDYLERKADRKINLKES